jgi:predicted nucleic acid-binding protein
MERPDGRLGFQRTGFGIQAVPFVSRIVCNSGPLIALGILDKLNILKSLFDEVLVPEAVQKEIAQGGLKLSGVENFQRADWIHILRPKRNDALLTALLDAGEAAVIDLAREQDVRLVLIDERKARKVARDIYGLQPIGTVRVLVEAKRKNLLTEIASSLKALRQEGYWIHDDIVQIALREAGEI